MIPVGTWIKSVGNPIIKTNRPAPVSAIPTIPTEKITLKTITNRAKIRESATIPATIHMGDVSSAITTITAAFVPLFAG